MQFRLRSLLVMVSCAALGAAAAAPWFRSLGELAQMRLAVVLGILGVINFASVAIVAVFEASERRSAGECWKVTSNNLRRMWLWVSIGIWGVLAGVHGWLLIREVTYETAQGRGMDRMLYDGFPGILLLSYVGPMLALNSRMTHFRFHERGLIFGPFIPRTSITSWKWVGDRLLLSLDKHRQHPIPVRQEDQADVEAILERWVAANAVSLEPIPSSKRAMLAIPCVFFVPLLLMIWRFLTPAPPLPGPALKARVPVVVAPASAGNMP